MSRFDFDLFTIGAGSGGVAGSRRAGTYGAKVAIAESVRVGGTCVLRGCVPKKLLVYGSGFSRDFEDAAGFGWTVGERRLDWAKLIERKDRELDRLHAIYIAMLKNAGVRIIDGRARLVDAHTVQVAGKTYTADKIMIATGGWPALPKLPGIEHAITSNEALDLKQLPRRMVIVGGGYIAVEFAGIFRNAGVEVTEILRADTVLRGFDDDVRQHLAAELAKQGIKLMPRTQVVAIEKTADGFAVATDAGQRIETDLVLYATGRAPNTAGMGLAEAGVTLNKAGAIAVDEWSRSTVETIYAVGDVTNRMNLTPVAIAEARAVAETLFNKNPIVADHANVPSAVFSQPPVATVGLSEAAARNTHRQVDVYVTRFKPMLNTLAGRDERTLMKLVVDGASDRVLGCHMVGADAPEIIQGMAVALKCGATKRQFDATVGIHPSAAEEFVTLREKHPELPAKAAD
ncbi:MAG: glutathione-disulfide reductase [Proteobacteria bacterium]|nr:glutathione-disulfide reductase [Pseudomonadota bacterium]MBI3497753.1 glutathione-disulfide reductase [Pseudomonadota bacterium]